MLLAAIKAYRAEFPEVNREPDRVAVPPPLRELYRLRDSSLW